MHILQGEFLGCLFLILFGGGSVANAVLSQSKGEPGAWISITAGWAFAVLMGVLVATATGSPQADINPAVTLAKYWLGIYPTFIPVLCAMLAQISGCFVGATLVWLVYYPHFEATHSAALKLVIFCTKPAISHLPSNLLCEVVGTFALVFGIGAIAHFEHIANGLAPYFVALLVWGIGLSLGGPTGYAINPARDLGPRLAHSVLPIAGKGSSHWSYALVPIVGPFIGAVLAAQLWQWLL